MGFNSDDILLLKLIKEGDQIAFKHLFYLYADSLERFIMYYINNKDKAQEIVLDIFTYIWENRERFEIRLTLKAYLFQSAKNKAFTYIRDKKTSIYLDDVDLVNKIQQYDSQLELNELSKLIEEAICLLPDKCRIIFEKSRKELLTNKEIASELKISEKTVEGQITIALKKIRTFLGDAYSYLW
ncbi:MAG: RNA polymerase sigma-70 factor [Massilibacteroides sp.]|nr:RNA polymerase sigma-70 factor [Massilibacteroides sp.]MDD3062585.1 RNA polymerase sigma-70 factor [Massilibacteroides sp.]MDD4116426.1 RNA polymerase sigma-70 factor [Massilibacteroides sp.]MDD4660148.1 RNA polymerase sigma-70 factor [Massilibacteroides sp.]